MERKYLRFSKQFEDVANIVIIDGEVIKNRNNIIDINQEIINNNKVIVQTNGKLTCYFNKKDKKDLVFIISRLPDPMTAYENILIVS